ncbi:hypothetical protein MGSAQ_003156, partial [marine sediment metagenome]
ISKLLNAFLQEDSIYLGIQKGLLA